MAESLTSRPGYPSPVRPAIGLVLVMVLMMVGAGYAGMRVFDSLEQLHDSASRASEEATAAEQVLDSLQDSETAVRGYLLTQRPAYLEPYQDNRSRMEVGLHELDILAAESPWLADEARRLRADAEARLAEIDRTLNATRAAGPEAGLAVILTDQGRQEMEAARTDCTQILQHADAEREARTQQLITRERQTLYWIVAAALAGTLLLGFAALSLLIGRARLVSAQTALSVQSGRLQATVDHIRDGVAVFDADDRLLLWNRSFFPISGLPTALAVPATPFGAFMAAAAGWEPPLLSSARPTAEPAESLGQEMRVGEKVLEVWRGEMPYGGHLLAVTDITRRAHAETIARQAQKMEALGQLTGGVAHDFNNLLQVISANLELVDTRLPADGADAAWLRARLLAARSGVERGTRLVQHLLAFARRQPLTPLVTDPARLLRGMEEILRRALGPAMTISLTLPDEVWMVRVDPQQLESAVLNLAINARDAMDAAGQHTAALQVALRNASLNAVAARQQGLTAGDYICLAVTDRGTGMSEATIERAVEPFFTTKAEGKGTGLGLPMVYGFTQQSGGTMKIASTPGQGTTVSLWIPRFRGSPASDGDPPKSPLLPAGGERERPIA